MKPLALPTAPGILARVPASRSFLLHLSSALLVLLAPPTGRAAESPVVSDDAIVQRIESEGNALIRAGKTVKLKTLRLQLPKVHTCSLALPPASAEALSPDELYERRSRGVLVIGVLAKPKKKTRYEMAGCSGFAITADGILVTNYHVVDNPEGETMVAMTREGQVTPITEILAADKLSDVAILRAPGATFTPLPLAAELPAAGSSIWVISHPDHNFYSITGGIVSRHFIATTEAGKTPQMAITADFGAGSSGGPILNRQGEVGGMVCSTTSVYWEDAKAKINDLQMVFKHCVPVPSIRRLIEPPKP